jgi:hypothetical protein
MSFFTREYGKATRRHNKSSITYLIIGKNRSLSPNKSKGINKMTPEAHRKAGFRPRALTVIAQSKGGIYQVTGRFSNLGMIQSIAALEVI